jgi:hypothetical protein
MAQIVVSCTFCNKKILRYPSDINIKHNFCDHHCAASFTNRIRITRLSAIRQARKIQSSLCKRQGCSNHVGLENRMYCSNQCKKDYYQKDHQNFRALSYFPVNILLMMDTSVTLYQKKLSMTGYSPEKFHIWSK